MYLPRAFYFLYYAATASLSPFLPLHYQSLGLSGSQIGVLASIPPFLVLFGASAWGVLADATQRHRGVLCLAIVGAAAGALLLAAAPTFGWLVLAVLTFAAFMAPIVPLVDNSVVAQLGAERERYGRIRLWGALGWGACAPLAGRLVERGGLQWSFRAFVVLMLGCLLVGARLRVVAVPLAGPLRSGLRALLADRRWRLFLFLAFAGGVGMGFVHNFLFLYMDGIGASRTTMGLALSVATVSELVVFSQAHRWLARWGVHRVLAFAMLATAVRLLAYAALPHPGWVLLVQLLHGPTFALAWTAGVAGASRLAPPGLGATAQGLFTGVNFGLGGAAGAMVGGVLYQEVGAQAMYSLASAAVFSAVAVYLVLSRGGRGLELGQG